MSEAQNIEQRIEQKVASFFKEHEGSIRQLLERLESRLEKFIMTMQSIESIVSEISSKVDAVKSEVDDLIARLGTVGAGGLTSAEVAQLASDLQAVSDKFASIAPEPSA